MQKIYRLTPATKDNIWGGNKLRAYGKESEKDRIAESWELSFTNGGEARIADGREMSEAFPRETWGTSAEKFHAFPVLTKFIDAQDKLSVQVHPSDTYALENEGQFGKTEMWYVVEADEGAGLYMGLERECDPDEFAAAVADGSVEKLLSFKEVKRGDVYFIPSGTIHAIGAGVVIFEIQQNSTLTYRLYDYMRRDKDGNLRELHVDKAADVTKRCPPVIADSSDRKTEKFENATRAELTTCDLFTMYKLDVDGKYSAVADDESFVSLLCLEGEGKVTCGETTLSFVKGESVFIPASSGEYTIEGKLEILESTL